MVKASARDCPKKTVPHDDEALEAERVAINEAQNVFKIKREEYSDA